MLNVEEHSTAKPEQANDKFRVFISYSRQDTVAADSLVAALEAKGFEVKIDRRNLPFGEKWQAELAEFIRLSDTVIWLVSEPSVRSNWVNWELDEVAKKNKRLIPVMVGETPRDTIPRQLGQIHILPAEGLFNAEHHLDTLVHVLETDRAWLKEGSRLQDRAEEWLAKKRSSALLLSRGALNTAEHWKERRPAKAPAPAQEVLELLLASRLAATRRQRLSVGLSLAVALVASTLAGVAYWQSVMASRQSSANIQLRKETQITESGLLSQGASTIMSSDPGTAMLLALEGMPDATAGVERPLVWEAHFALDQALRGNKEVMRGLHDGLVDRVAFSPDGRFLASASSDRTARLFEVATGKEVAQFKHALPVWRIAYSPDGRFLATATNETATAKNHAEVRLLETETRRELARVALEQLALDVAFSTDGKFLAAASWDGFALILDGKTGKELTRLRHGHLVNRVVFSPDGRLLATASNDNTARLFEVETWKELAQIPHDEFVNVVAFAPNSEVLVTATNGGTLRLFDVVTASERGRLKVNKCCPSNLVFSPDGKLLAAGSFADEPVARLFAVTTDQLIEVARLAHDGRVNSVVFSADGRFITTAAGDKLARVFDAKTLKEFVRFRLDSEVYHATFSPDNRLLATASTDRTARLFEIRVGNELTRFRHEDWVHKATFSPDYRFIATAASKGGANLFDVATGKALTQLPHDRAVVDVAFSPDGRLLATASSDHSARVFRMEDRKKLAEWAHDRWVRRVVFSPDGSLLATASFAPASAQGEARLFETATMKELAKLVHADAVWHVRFSPDGRLLATASWDKTARLYETAKGKELVRLAHDDQVLGLNFNATGTLVATASRDKKARVFQVPGGKMLAELAHEGGVNHVAFSPDGRFLVTASDDATARIYDATFKELFVLIHSDLVQEAVFSRDGLLLATASGDSRNARGEARLFEAATGKELARLRHENQVYGVEFDAAGSRLLTWSIDQTARLWQVFPSVQTLVDAAKTRATRCLTPNQRKQYFLPAAPPAWCVERSLWPYHREEWKSWLSARKAWLADRTSPEPGMPKAE